MTTLKDYYVIVGNIGRINCRHSKHAHSVFNDYREISKSCKGRAGGESVTLWCGEDLLKEHVGRLDREEP